MAESGIVADSPNWISCSQYAKRRGVSRMSVSTAIASGRLSKSVVRVGPHNVPKICDPDLADREWEANTDPVKRVAAAGNDPAAWTVRPAVVADDPSDEIDDQPEPAAAAGRDLASIATSTERLKAAQADIAELKRDEARGVLITASSVRAEWTDLLSQVRTKLLGIPSKVRHAIPTLSATDVVVIENLIRDALEDLVAAEGGAP